MNWLEYMAAYSLLQGQRAEDERKARARKDAWLELLEAMDADDVLLRQIAGEWVN